MEQMRVFKFVSSHAVEETSLYVSTLFIPSLPSTRSKTGLLNFGVRLQETSYNMAEYFGLLLVDIMPSLGTYMDNNAK